MNEYISVLVDELHQLGVTHVVYSPGSRSTALAILFEEHGQFQTYMNIDERSSAFMALGMAKVHKQPTVLVCTSGSAMAHYFPAITEAYQAEVPLIILTADRPPHLQRVGAPQTIDQEKLFGKYVLYDETLTIPYEEMQRYTYGRKVAQRAYVHAMNTRKGPVHINIPLEEPLVPDMTNVDFSRNRQPFAFVPGKMIADVSAIVKDWHQERVLLLAGPVPYSADEKAILAMAEHLQAPILADPLSQLRRFDSPYLMDAYDAILMWNGAKEVLHPTVVIQLGQMPVSKRVQQWMASLRDSTYIQVDPTGTFKNPSGTTTHYVQSSIGAGCASFQNSVSPQDSHYVSLWQQWNQKGRKSLDAAVTTDAWFEGKVLQYIQRALPTGQLVVANSLSIRDVDYFWTSGRSEAYIYGNRGTNGIDGTVSTALGISTNGKKTVLVTGDLSFFHDLNGLAIGRTHDVHLTIVLHNNDGGGIFHHLPQRDNPHFDYLFSTPQHLDYQGAAQLYGLHYVAPTSYEELAEAVAEDRPGITLIEVRTDKEKSRLLRINYTKESCE